MKLLEEGMLYPFPPPKFPEVLKWNASDNYHRIKHHSTRLTLFKQPCSEWLAYVPVPLNTYLIPLFYGVCQYTYGITLPWQLHAQINRRFGVYSS